MIIKLKKRQKRFLKEIYRRAMSGALAFVMLITSYIPFPTYALTGGPSQPEVQGFTPIGTSDMVDLFSGDFKYNIPLLSVDGYPINIGYSGNIGMDQEASWVGLGWNLNVGTVNRAVRGIPDDFNGEEIKTTTHQMPTYTLSAETGFNLEIFGMGSDDNSQTQPIHSGTAASLNLGGSVGLSFNNYTGLGISLGLDISGGIGPLNGNLGLHSSSDNGLSIQPNVSLSARLKKGEETQSSLSASVGSSFNSRSGLQELSVSTSMRKNVERQFKGKDGKTHKRSSSHGIGGSASFDMMQPTFTPQISQSMISTSLSGKFKLGPAAFGTHATGSVSASFSYQGILNKNLTNNAYGYLNSQNVTNETKKKAILDFNRENDGTFSDKTPALPLTNHTYDIFSVSGQGTGGSYRPFRSEVGRVYDPTSRTISVGGSAGGELGAGALFKAGANINVNTVNAKSGDWTSENFAKNTIRYRNDSPYQDYEKYYFKEANEMNVTSDPDFINRFGGYQAISLNLDEIANFKTAATPHWQSNAQPSKHAIAYNYRDERERRNNVFQTLSRSELERGYGLEDAPADPNNKAKADHIAEITNLGPDGSRYVYGTAAYNNVKEEVTFSIANDVVDLVANAYPYDPDYETGLIQYNSDVNNNADNSVNNKWGVDKYYNKVTTPAYAHSYLLTAIISPDYVDTEDDGSNKGPSDGDMGSWTKFHYEKSSDAYQWRVPFEEDRASFQEGMKTDDTDDKASYIYGTKEIHYIDSIETKNFIAVFHKSYRDDALGVKDENGGADTTDNELKMKKLDKIILYSKPDRLENGESATPIKTVHFEYDYSLCEGVPNNKNFIAGGTEDLGKLTLKRVYFTYRGSKKGKLSPYSFVYSNNYDYNLRGYDRWGNYKPNEATDPASYPEFDASNNSSIELTNPEFPYVDQSNPTMQNSYAAAWAMTKVNLPSGGDIDIVYESDDYMHVQNKKAMQMYKLIGGEDHDGNFTNANVTVLGDDNKENRKIYFDIPSGSDINEIVGDIDNLYFKCLMEYPVGTTPMYEFVQGYCEISSYGTYDNGGTTVGWILPKPVKLADRDNETAKYSPIARAGIQFGRLYLSKYIFNEPALGNSNNSFGAAFVQDLVNVFDNFIEGFKNPNLALWDDAKGTKFVKNKSWIRLNHSEDGKMGGGNRVAQVKINDNWDVMTSEDEFDYGQEYDYTTTDNDGNIISSGVASYEPQLGGEENPWKQPVSYEKENRLAPNERFYQSAPFGESFFPSASVGYSKVTVKNLDRTNVTRHATGEVVHTFYTAKDFPTKVGRTVVDDVHQKNDPFSVNSLFKIDSKDFMTVSQGFYVETNDMHGKPRSQSVYQEGRTDPITSVSYYYADDTNDDDIISNLDNEVKTIMPDGTVADATVGVHFDIVTDFREHKTSSLSVGAQINADGFPLLIVPVVIPTIWPSFKLDRTKFRSVSTTKVVQRFGVLEKTVATDLGSRVETENLAYDGVTGQVLLTKTKTNFQDDVYTLQYPAYWYYDAMGPAYQNAGITDALKQFDANGTASISNAEFRYAEGDELILDEGILNNNVTKRGWVVDVSQGEITVMLKNGNPYSGFANRIKVIRSGRRNQQMNPMASVTSRVNPLTSFSSNLYKNVIQASAIEFTDKWRSYCDCFIDDDGNAISTNPYVLGTKGNWRPKTSYLHLAGRTQSDFNNNTNIRDDGFFESFTPFYTLNAGAWGIDRDDWTYTAEVTEFNPFGQELENQDALGRYSAATFGFNQTLATSVAANTRYHELGFDGFEDYDFSNCADKHFEFTDFASNIVDTIAHTGYHSIAVSAGTDVTLDKALVDPCDDTDCALDIVATLDSSDPDAVIVNFTPSNATGYVLAEWNELSNDGGVISYSPSTNTISYDDMQSSALIEIIYTDSEGCRVEKTYAMSFSGGLVEQ